MNICDFFVSGESPGSALIRGDGCMHIQKASLEVKLTNRGENERVNKPSFTESRSKCPHWARAIARRWKLNARLPCGWQECNSLTYHCCSPPKSALPGSWSQVSEWGIQHKHLGLGVDKLVTRLNTSNPFILVLITVSWSSERLKDPQRTKS